MKFNEYEEMLSKMVICDYQFCRLLTLSLIRELCYQRDHTAHYLADKSKKNKKNAMKRKIMALKFVASN